MANPAVLREVISSRCFPEPEMVVRSAREGRGFITSVFFEELVAEETDGFTCVSYECCSVLCCLKQKHLNADVGIHIVGHSWWCSLCLLNAHV